MALKPAHLKKVEVSLVENFFFARKDNVLRKLFLLSLIALFMLMAFSPSDTALAASTQQRHIQARQVHAAALLPAVTCSKNGCTGLDPVQTGCSASASTILSAGIFNNSRQRIGTVNLRFSSACGANWAQVVSSIGSVAMSAEVVREAGADGPVASSCEPTNCTQFITASSAFTNMVWAPDVPTQALGQMDAVLFGACVTQDPKGLPCP